MTSSTPSLFEQKVQRFQKLVHEMAKAISKSQAMTSLDCSSHILEKFPEMKHLSCEEAAHFCASRFDCLSLHALQHFHLENLLSELEVHLEKLPVERALHLRKALKTSLSRYLDGLDYPFPYPKDAPQPLWNDTLEKVKTLRFEKPWQFLAQHLHQQEACYILYKEPTSWKIRALQRLALAKVLGHSKSKVKLLLRSCYIPNLCLWGRHPLEDEKIAKLIQLVHPQESLELEEFSKLTPALETAIIESMSYLQSLSFNRCKSIAFKNVLSTPAPFLRKLTLRAARFQKEDFSQLQMPKLYHLDLSESNFSSDHIVTINSMPTLRHLNLHRCYDVTTMSVELLKSKFPFLKELVLDSCGSLYNKALAALPSHLSSLSVGWLTTLNDEGFEKIAFDSNCFRSFHAKNCSGVNDQVLELVAKQPLLSSLHLDYCHKLSPKALDLCLPSLGKLSDLSLKGLTLYTDSWKHLESLPLQRLQMPLWINMPQSFHFPALKHLDLGKSATLSPDDFEYLLSQESLRGLQSFFVEDAHGLSDALLPVLSQWQQLRHLRIWNSLDSIQLFSLEAAEQLYALKNLEHLELAHCGTFSLASLETLLKKLSNLKTFEFGPLFEISPEDIRQLQKRVSWVKITCYHYPEIASF